MGQKLKFIGVIVGIVVVARMFAPDQPSTDGRTTGGQATAVQVAALLPEQSARRAEQAARRAELLSIPVLRAGFVQAVVAGQQAYRATRDEFRQGATRPARKQAICALPIARTMSAQDWVGQVSTRSTNGEGKGVLGIKLGDDLEIKTWNNSLSDIGDNTFVEPGSPLFEAIGAAQKGDWVRVSGRLIRSNTDCMRETSMSLSGSMTEPDFLFRFERMERINLP